MALGHRRLRRIPSVFAVTAPLSGYRDKALPLASAPALN